jgi:hypothetical protein
MNIKHSQQIPANLGEFMMPPTLQEEIITMKREQKMLRASLPWILPSFNWAGVIRPSLHSPDM